MWLGKKSARRQAIREDVAEAESLVRQQPLRAWPIVLLTGFFFLIATALTYYPSETIPYYIGQKAPFDLHSRVDFKIKNPDLTERNRAEARAAAPAVLTPNPPAFDLIQSQLGNLRDDARTFRTLSSLPAEIKARWPGLTAEGLNWLQQEVDLSAYDLKVRVLLTQVLTEIPLVDRGTYEVISTRQSDRVNLAGSAGVEGIMPTITRADVVPLGAPQGPASALLHREVGRAFPQMMIEPIVNYLLQLKMPTFRYDPLLTISLADRDAARKEPWVRQTEAIVRAGDIIDANAYALLVTAQDEYERDRIRHEPWAWWLAKLGQALSVLLITVAGALYVTRLNPNLNDARRGWALVLLLLAALAIAKISVAFFANAQYLMGIAPTLLAAAVLIVAYAPRFALGAGALHGLLVTLALNQNFDFFLTILSGLALLVFGLKEIRTLGKLIEVGIFVGAALFACVWSIGLARYMSAASNFTLTPAGDIHTIALNSLWAAGAGIAVGFLTLGLLPMIERVFKITSAMTLLSLGDTNRPLLQRLAAEAPGTFNHSLIVGLLAENAATAIGGNGLLCRVGAYYHDIGKLSKPQYFAENQAGGPNRHDKLSPAMSLLIIVGHVKDGIELACEYGLPAAVQQFIAQHHGTTLVEYFFNVARERQMKEMTAKGEMPPVSETEFRYPGPRPQSRESAILMICDGVESLTRSMPDHTPGRLETVVHQLVTKRLMDGQFSDCDLTLKDLAVIEQSLVRTLAGVYHGRVAYPRAPAVRAVRSA